MTYDFKSEANYIWKRLSDPNTLTVGDLPERYIEHCLRSIAEQMEKDRKMFPDDEWVKNDFNISKALYSICCEMDYLSRQISDLQ